MDRENTKTPIPPSACSDELEAALAALPAAVQNYTTAVKAAEHEEHMTRIETRRDRIRLRQTSSTFPRPNMDEPELKMPKAWLEQEATQPIKKI